MKKYWLWFGLSFPFIILAIAVWTTFIADVGGIYLLSLPFILTGTLGTVTSPEGFCKGPPCPSTPPSEMLTGIALLILWFLFYFIVGALIGWIYGKVKNTYKTVAR